MMTSPSIDHRPTDGSTGTATAAVAGLTWSDMCAMPTVSDGSSSPVQVDRRRRRIGHVMATGSAFDESRSITMTYRGDDDSSCHACPMMTSSICDAPICRSSSMRCHLYRSHVADWAADRPHSTGANATTDSVPTTWQTQRQFGSNRHRPIDDDHDDAFVKSSVKASSANVNDETRRRRRSAGSTVHAASDGGRDSVDCLAATTGCTACSVAAESTTTRRAMVSVVPPWQHFLPSRGDDVTTTSSFAHRAPAVADSTVHSSWSAAAIGPARRTISAPTHQLDHGDSLAGYADDVIASQVLDTDDTGLRAVQATDDSDRRFEYDCVSGRHASDGVRERAVWSSGDGLRASATDFIDVGCRSSRQIVGPRHHQPGILSRNPFSTLVMYDIILRRLALEVSAAPPADRRHGKVDGIKSPVDDTRRPPTLFRPYLDLPQQQQQQSSTSEDIVVATPSEISGRAGIRPKDATMTSLRTSREPSSGGRLPMTSSVTTTGPHSKKYRCDLCGRSFSRSNTLVTHRVNNSSGVLFYYSLHVFRRKSNRIKFYCNSDFTRFFVLRGIKY